MSSYFATFIAMHIGNYRINLDALLARILYRWRWHAIIVIFLLIGCISLGSGLIPPFWNGRAELVITAIPGATIRIDGRSWPRPVYAGRHAITATLPDRRSAWADVDLRAGETLTVTLPAANYAGSLVPLTWDDDGLLWVAPGAEMRSILSWR